MNRRSLSALLLAAVVGTACADDGSTPVSPDTEVVAPALTDLRAQEPPIVEGRVLARFLPGAPAADVAAAAGATIDRPLVLGIQLLSVPAGAEFRIAEALSNNPNVAFAEPDYLRTLGDPDVMPVNDGLIGYKWDLDNDGTIYNGAGDPIASTGKVDADMDWREAVEAVQAAGPVSGSARIGIIDSGIRNDHEEFVGRIAAQYDFFADDGDAEDDNGHGSHVAGISAGSTDNGVGMAGVAFAGNVTFAVAKVCGPINPGPMGYRCPTSAIASGVVWAVDNGAHVLNLSLGGGGGSTATRDALQYAVDNGVLPFCSAGNDGGAVSYPAAWPQCVAVSATDWNDELASYSNSGPEVELAAPGGDSEDPDGFSYIASAYNRSSSDYALLAGTSMASPQAAGLGALLHVLGVTDAAEKLAIMKGTADDLGPATSFGSGRINVAAAVAAAGLGGGGGDPNAAPEAGFTFDCTDLGCSFTDASIDSDGSIVSWAWDFGDAATSSDPNPSHTYASGGTYGVSLTVRDDDGASDTFSADVTVSEAPEPPPSGDIQLTASSYKERGTHRVELGWSGASSTNVDIFRDGDPVATVPNDDGFWSDPGIQNNRGGATYVYQVCEAGTSACSATVTVVF